MRSAFSPPLTTPSCRAILCIAKKASEEEKSTSLRSFEERGAPVGCCKRPKGSGMEDHL